MAYCWKKPLRNLQLVSLNLYKYNSSFKLHTIDQEFFGAKKFIKPSLLQNLSSLLFVSLFCNGGFST